MWSPAVANGELYRLITSAFLHSGITHILFNMFALFVVGPPLEIWLGRLRFGALYLLSALGGSVLIYLFSPLNARDGWCVGSGIRLVRSHFRGRQEGQRRHPLGRHHDRDQPGDHVHRAVDQLAGTSRRTGDGRAGRVRLRYAPASNRILVQAGATVGMLVLFVALIWWRTSYTSWH